MLYKKYNQDSIIEELDKTLKSHKVLLALTYG